MERNEPKTPSGRDVRMDPRKGDQFFVRVDGTEVLKQVTVMEADPPDVPYTRRVQYRFGGHRKGVSGGSTSLETWQKQDGTIVGEPKEGVDVGG